jgi:hypothetical protein
VKIGKLSVCYIGLEEINITQNGYYVYEHIRLDNNTCFYVGKGTNNRYKCKTRNKLHDEIVELYGMESRIVIDGLTEEEAYQEEYNLINKYVFELGYGIDVAGYGIKDKEYYLTNQNFGGIGVRSGEENPMWGVSPKERMDGETYKVWYEKTRNRLLNQTGDKNPNYRNDTLHNKLKDNPELRIQYYARNGSVNGRSRRIRLTSSDKTIIKEFDYIGEGCQWIKDTYNITSNINSMRSNMSIAAKKGKTYRGFYIEFID